MIQQLKIHIESKWSLMIRVVCWRYSIQQAKVRAHRQSGALLTLQRNTQPYEINGFGNIYTLITTNHGRDGEGFLLVYSICSRSSFERVRRFQEQIHRVKDSSLSTLPTPQRSPDSPYPPQSKIPLMLVGNKADRSTEREVSAQEGRSLATELGCLFTESSAKTCQNVELAFYEVVRQIRRQREGEKEQLLGKSKSRNSKGKYGKSGSGRSGKMCTIL